MFCDIYFDLSQSQAARGVAPQHFPGASGDGQDDGLQDLRFPVAAGGSLVERPCSGVRPGHLHRNALGRRGTLYAAGVGNG